MKTATRPEWTQEIYNASNMALDQQSLARLSFAQSAEAALRELGCTLSPAHDRLWIVPRGKLRAAKRISRENRYPAAFRVPAAVRLARAQLHNYATGEIIRPATAAELESSRAAGHEGVIEVDGISCYVQE